VKAVYRPNIILARTISIELTLRRSFPEIAAANCCARFLESPFDEQPLLEQFLPLMARNHSAELAAQTLACGH
jgi:hypothetical protein